MTRVRWSVTVAMCLIAVAAAGPAAAQGEAEQRGFIHGLGGLTFGTETAGTFGVEFGVNAGSHVQITGEVGTMRNILPTWVQDEADEGSELLELALLLVLGLPVDIGVDAMAPAFYGTGGVRLLASAAGTQPYVSLNGGFANVSPEVRLRLNGDDVTEDAIREGLLERFDSVTKFQMGVGGGVSVPVGGAVELDLGYRYMRIFTNQAINVHRVHGGVGVRF